MTQDAEQFRCWAIVEVMGHRRYAGLVTEQVISGQGFVRVDVPEIINPDPKAHLLAGFTKIFGPGSIYAITPCTETTARAFAENLREQAFSMWDIPQIEGPKSDIRGNGYADFVEQSDEEIKV